MKTYILLANIESNERSDIENLEGSFFFTPAEALQCIGDNSDTENKCVPLTEFLEMVNNEEFGDAEYWITSLNIKRPQ